jgi:hypothetical protein
MEVRNQHQVSVDDADGQNRVADLDLALAPRNEGIAINLPYVGSALSSLIGVPERQPIRHEVDPRWTGRTSAVPAVASILLQLKVPIGEGARD